MKYLRLLLLGLVAGVSFHINSTLLFAVLGVAPSDQGNWRLALILTTVWAICAASAGLQPECRSPRGSQLMGTVSGATSGAVWGLFIAGQLGDQQLKWAVLGLCTGSLVTAVLAAYSFGPSGATDGVVARALRLMSGVCAYAIAFYFWSWALASLGTQRYGLATVFVIAVSFFLWTVAQIINQLSHS